METHRVNKDRSSVYGVLKCSGAVHIPYVLYEGENTVTIVYWFIDRLQEIRNINVTASP
jgi:hypothetical protein